jgi:hypothetical protein
VLLATYRGGVAREFAAKRHPYRAICKLEVVLMKYPDGRDVKLGDIVALGKNQKGVVVCSIDTEEYSDAFPKIEWNYLNNGVLISFPSYGLIHYKEPEPDLRLVARASDQSQLG